MAIKSFEDLEVWQLSSQLRSATVSIGANIAEGSGRYHYKDNIKFLYNARGSLLETRSHLLVAKDLGFVKSADLDLLLKEIQNLGVKLNNFINFLKERSN